MGGPDGNQGLHTNATQAITNGTAIAKRSHVQSLSDFAIGFGNAALPVVLSSFTAFLDHQTVLLQWTTQSETQSDRFGVQRSEDGIQFETTGTVNAEGNSTTENHYSYKDDTPLSRTSYYRLSQVDDDGRVSFSSIKVVEQQNEIQNVISIYPNPANNELFIYGLQTNSEIQITDVGGKTVMYTLLMHGAEKLDVSKLAAGQYFLSINSEKSRMVKMIVLQ